MMELQRPEQYTFILTCDGQESDLVHTAITRPASQGAAEDYERARAHERLQRTLPPAADFWQVTISAIELIAIHRATRNLQYRLEFGEAVCNSAKVFTDALVQKGYDVKYYLA